MKNYFHSAFFKTVDYLKLHQNTYIIIISMIIGILAGYGAIGFRYLIDFFQSMGLKPGEELIEILRTTPWYYKLLLPTIGGAIVGPLIYFFAREAKGHGVPEVIEAVAMRGGRIRPRVVVVKSLASALSIGTGGSVGREGPIVQIGSAIGSTMGQWLQLSQERIKTLVACGAAAGIAATFNAPITGVLFSIEIILGNFAIHTFSPLVVSSVLATVISRHHLGDMPAFIVPHYNLESPWELPLYFLLGFIIAMIGLVFMKSIHYLEDFFANLKIPDYFKTPIGMFGLGIIICVFPHVFGNGYETITLSLSDNMGIWLLLMLIPIKILATSLTLGAGGSGGILAPSLFLGAVTGGFFGKIVHHLIPAVTATSGAYAMVGMGAMVGSVTFAPVTAIITLFELTGEYKIILPLMFSCIFATLITSSLSKDSIYTAKLSRRGAKINVGMEAAIMNRNVVREIMHIDVPTIDPETPFEPLFNHIINSQQDHFYVVGLDGKYLGEICIHDVSRVMKREGIRSDRKAIDLMNRSYPKASPDDTLMECVRTFGISGVQELPVVNRSNNDFLGVINYQDIFRLYNREVLREGTLGLKFVTRTPEIPRSDYVNIPEGYDITLVPVVGPMVGKSIKNLNLRSKYNVNVVAIKPISSHETQSEIPTPDRILSRQDNLIIVGKKIDLARVRTDLVHE